MSTRKTVPITGATSGIGRVAPGSTMLRAAADGANFVEVLRIKTGASGDGWAQERLTVRVGVGRAEDFDFAVSQTASDRYGSLIGLSIVPSGSGCVVRASSAGRASSWGTPD